MTISAVKCYEIGVYCHIIALNPFPALLTAFRPFTPTDCPATCLIGIQYQCLNTLTPQDLMPRPLKPKNVNNIGQDRLTIMNVLHFI